MCFWRTHQWFFLFNHRQYKNWRVESRYKKYGINAAVFDYAENINELYDWANLIVCRSGSTTLSEISTIGRAIILVPFPFATDNHQFWNAKRYFDPNCCWILEEKNFMPGDIYKIIDRIMIDKNEYILKKNNLKKLNENNTWENINKKFIKYFNEN